MLGGPLMADHLLPVPLMVGDILRPVVYLVGGLLSRDSLKWCSRALLWEDRAA